MLKWLVTRGPHPPQPPREVVTDDPLATLGVKNNDHHIYAVSRVNPLYHEDETGTTEGLEEDEEVQELEIRQKEEVLLESPPIDRSSVRSSGYGSKETDSASERSDAHDDDDLLGAEVRTTSASSSYAGDGSRRISLGEEGVAGEDNGKGSSEVKESQSAVQLRLSLDASGAPRKGKSNLVSVRGKHIAAIVSKDPEFVQAIEMGLRRTRSLEIVRQHRPFQQSGSSTVPRPIWPRDTGLADDQYQVASKRTLQQVRESFTRPESQRVPSPVDILKQDIRYVTAIDVMPKRAKSFTPGLPRPVPGSANTTSHDVTQTKKLVLHHDDRETSITRYFGGEHSNSSYVLMSLQPDSLVTEETLRMMRYGREEDLLEENHYESPINVAQTDHSIAMPDFSQAMYTRGLYATLNRAASLNTKDIVKPPYKVRSKSFDISIPSHKICAKKRGLSAVKDLWEKSGLKTNGRKLIVNDDLLDNRLEEPEDPSRRLSVGSSVEQLRSVSSSEMTSERHLKRLESDNTTTTNRSSGTYEEPYSLESIRYSSHPSLETKSSGSYAEINDIVIGGIDNPSFLEDNGRPRFPSPPPLIHHNGKPLMPANKFLDPDKLAAFQKKISEKLQGAPLHRMQWLDLDDITVDDAVDIKHERRVKFTADTINPGSLERGAGRGAHQAPRRSSPVPGRALKLHHKDSDELEPLQGRNLHQVATEPTKQATSDTDHKGIWAISESYRGRFQEAPSGTVGRGKRQQLWETYYGTAGSIDRTLPRHLAPHPNSQAPFCTNPGPCHDFTLDLRRSDKLRKRSEARRRRRRCYVIILLIVALCVFLGVVVAVSFYYTRGEKFF
ncbi:hypothetical protein OTU49_007755, partial [Cherax quadricarinatus]